MNLRLIVTILVIAAAPVCAQALKPTSEFKEFDALFQKMYQIREKNWVLSIPR